MGRDKVEDKLKEISFCIEVRDFRRASKLLSDVSNAIPSCSREDALKILEFLDFYSEKLESLEKKLVWEASNKTKVKKSYLK